MKYLLNNNSKIYLALLVWVLFSALPAKVSAEQAKVPGGAGVAGAAYQRYYLPTAKLVYDRDGNFVADFSEDDYTGYPFETYLPNERRPDRYRIHTNFQNTDVCASCHTTHTAVGPNLLQWYSVYDTCMACHDGTVTTTYNVADGAIRNTGQPTLGGRFGLPGEDANDSLSNHNVTGAVAISAAPGGSVTAAAYQLGNMTVERWSGTFGCESCHEPHGSGGNARLLNPDPNYMQTARGSRDYQSFELTRAVETINGAVYYTVYDNTFGYLYILKGYPYKLANKFYLLPASGTAAEMYPKVDFTLDNSDGYSKLIFNLPTRSAPEVGDVVYGSFIPAWKVKMKIENYLGFDSAGGEAVAGEIVNYWSGMNGFCGSCHPDYNTAGAGDGLSGSPSGEHRHLVGISVADGVYQNLKLEHVEDSTGYINCLTCHVAHGVSRIWWNEALNTNPDKYGFSNESIPQDQLVEQFGSSALKRKPNNLVCTTCHGEGVNSEGHDSPVIPAAANNQVGATYVGTGQCRSCHTRYASGWEKTNHAHDLIPVPGNISNLFQPLTIDTGNTYNAADLLFLAGGKYLVARGKTNSPYAGRLVWLAVYNEGSLNYESATRPFESECANCHLTGRKLYPGQAGNVQAVTWADPGIGCEACHGPGSKHQNNPLMSNITNPRRLTAARQTEICAQCHVYAGYDKYYYFNAATNSFSRDDSGLAYTYNGRLRGFNNYPFYNESVELAAYALVYSAPNSSGNRPLADSRLYVDAVSAVTHDLYGPQYEEFINSRHWTAGMSCITCHQSHGQNSEGYELKSPPVSTCVTCHDQVMDLDKYMNPVFTNGTEQRIIKTHAFKRPADYLTSRNPNP